MTTDRSHPGVPAVADTVSYAGSPRYLQFLAMSFVWLWVVYAVSRGPAMEVSAVGLGMLLLGVPTCMAGICTNALRRHRWLSALFREQGRLYKLLSKGLLSILFWTIGGLFISFFPLLQFHVCEPVEWAVIAATIPVFTVLFAFINRRLLKAGVHSDMAVTEGLAWTRVILIGTRILVDEVRFEWVPSGALLGELEGDRPVGDEPATAVDVVLWSRPEDGRRAVVLIEVKLSEDGFTTCNGRDSRGNRRKYVCKSARLFSSDPNACYLRRPWRKRRDRRYWAIFASAHGSVRNAFPGAEIDGSCPFAGNAQQPMRNLAIARALEQEGTVAEAWFVLCVQDDNPDVREHWKAWSGLLPDPAMAPLLPASAVVDVGEANGNTAWAAWMRERYLPGDGQPTR